MLLTNATGQVAPHCSKYPPSDPPIPLFARHADFPSPYTATSVSHLLQAGAEMIGKTSMDEFGMGSNTTNLPQGVAKVYNPWIPDTNRVRWTRDESMDGAVASSSRSLGKQSGHRSAGGSSGGSAVTVATGEAWA
jgi:aspartyl-tRNA(Asn)/glutamyl-tRNA(Gln) amidotransferase subunit A